MADDDFDYAVGRVYLGKPTNFIETLGHLLKGSLGSGILGMPLAMYWAGLWLGLIATPIIGFIVTYGSNLLVVNAQRIYKRRKICQLLYDEVGEIAIELGPESLRKYSLIMKRFVNFIIIMNLFGFCAVYNVFIARNVQQIVEHYSDVRISVRLYIVMLIPFLLPYIMIRTLKYLAPMSIISDFLIVIGMIVTLYFVFTDLPSPAGYPFFGSALSIAQYFGIVIYALEGICVIMPLENNMVDSHRFAGIPSIICIGMFIVVFLCTFLGFFGYLKYGEDIQGSITLNLPEDSFFIETLGHLLKGSLGSGILGMPLAMSWAGLWLGLIATPIIGVILAYGCNILVVNAQRIYKRRKVSQLLYDEVGEIAIELGPEHIRKYSIIMKRIINITIILNLFGSCAVYSVFIARNIQQIVEHYSDVRISVRLYILMLIPFLLAYIMIRTLKYLAPMSIISDFLIAIGMIVTLYFVFTDLPSPEGYPFFGHPISIAQYFGIVIFALEGICVVMPLENNMVDSHRFAGIPSIICIGMSIVVFMYTFLGFFGYLKYGEDIQGSITLNLPEDSLLAQSIKLIFAISIFHTYALQFYVPFQICWRKHKDKFGEYNLIAEYIARWFIVICISSIAIAIPRIGSIMSLIGALCLSFLGLIFPGIIDLCVCYETPGMGKYKWRLYVDICLIIMGFIACICGSMASIYELYHDFF